MDYVYDIETYPNIFSVVFACDEQRQIWEFEISDRKDDSKKLRAFLTKLYKEQARMIGFNNLFFDYPVIHWWLGHKGATYSEIYQYAMHLIESGNENRFANSLPEDKHFIKQLDLYKIYHFDNQAKATSLKMIEFNTRSREIEDLPFPVGKVLNDKQKDVLLKYNRKDVMETLKFYRMSSEAIELRETLSKEYGINCMNFNDTKIGKEYFVQRLEEEMPESCYKITKKGRKVNQTKRDEIALSDIIFPYVQFESPEFSAVLEWIKSQVIVETKGVFSDIPEHELGELAKYCRLTTKKKKLKMIRVADKETAKTLRKEMKSPDLSDEELEALRDQLCGIPDPVQCKEFKTQYPKGWIERTVLKSGKTSYTFNWNIAESLNVVVDGLEYVFGTGGLHASRESVTYLADDEYVILDFDYASMYPNIFISNRVYPEHLSEKFCDIYKDVYLKRKSFAKGTPQNAVMKLALNGTYGATNDQYSPFYDPKATMAITVNGQLTLCGLAEKLVKIPDLTMIQCNTDGLTVYCKRSDEAMIDKIVADWDAVVGLEMEKAVYSKMAIRDVNNYIAVYENGKFKRNGAYEYKIAHIDGEGLQFHQNQSMLVVKRAAFEAIANGVPIEKTIKECKDPFDFCLRTKVPRDSRLVLMDEEGIEYPEQNICRYYVAKNGLRMFKIMPPLEGKVDERYMSINAGQLVKTCNKIVDFDWDVDYDYYIQEANKLVEGVGLTVM